MQRRNFVISCGYLAIGIPASACLLPSCGAIYYAAATQVNEKLVVAKSEFLHVRENKIIERDFVLIKPENFDFPICLHHIEKENYVASLLKCTHQSCELNVGGGIFIWPCHGSEFSTSGKVLEGPAERDLITFKTESDGNNVQIILA